MDASSPAPVLEYYPAHASRPQRIALATIPFRIGRGQDAQFILSSNQVSKLHAEIVCADGQFHIRDLNSSNGIFVNGRRVAESILNNDDVFHLAQEEFRFVAQAPEKLAESHPFTVPIGVDTPTSLVRGRQNLRELIAQQWMRVVFQSIVHLDTGACLGFEALGRPTHANLKMKPVELFGLADQCGLAILLSKLCRQLAVAEAQRLPSGCHVFLNIHPSEMDDQTLLESLSGLLTEVRPDQQIVVEVNEHAIANLSSLRRFRDLTREAGIKFAYDDFGAGQARLMELAEVPPDFIKLDMSLVRDIHQAPARQALLQAINRASTELGVCVIAEGIETPQEAECCRRLGCQFGQGYLFGRPQSASMFPTLNHPTDATAPRTR